MLKLTQEQRSIIVSVECDDRLPFLYTPAHPDVQFLVANEVIQEKDGRWSIIKPKPSAPPTLPQTLEEAIAQAKAKKHLEDEAERAQLEAQQKVWYEEALTSFKLPFSEQLVELIKPKHEMRVYHYGINRDSVSVQAVFSYKGLIFQVYKDTSHYQRSYSEPITRWNCAGWETLDDEEPIEICQIDAPDRSVPDLQKRDHDLLIFIDYCVSKCQPKFINWSSWNSTSKILEKAFQESVRQMVDVLKSAEPSKDTLDLLSDRLNKFGNQFWLNFNNDFIVKGFVEYQFSDPAFKYAKKFSDDMQNQAAQDCCRSAIAIAKLEMYGHD